MGTISPQQPQSKLSAAERKEALGEQDRVARLGRIQQFVFGSLDGLLVPLGVVSGVAGGTGNVRAVIIAGLAEAFAGALSMGVGEFLSGRAEAQVQRAEVEVELRQVRERPAYELEELVVLLENDGIKEEDARKIAEILARNPDAFSKTMVEKELGLDVEPETVHIGESVTMGGSYMVASLVPLVAYFLFPIEIAFPVSLALTVVALIVIGFVRGNLAKINLLRSIIEVVVVGAVSGLGGYLLGTYLPKLFGY